MSRTQRLALLLAALCHDLEHPGVSAGYLLRARSRMAGWFKGDAGMLEKHHLVRTCELLACRRIGILAHLATEDRVEARRPPALARPHPNQRKPAAAAGGGGS